MKIIFIDDTVQEFEDNTYNGQVHNTVPVFKVENKSDTYEPAHLFPLFYIKEIIL